MVHGMCLPRGHLRASTMPQEQFNVHSTYIKSAY
jgi:hypothetical protein